MASVLCQGTCGCQDCSRHRTKTLAVTSKLRDQARIKMKFSVCIFFSEHVRRCKGKILQFLSSLALFEVSESFRTVHMLLE